MDSKSSQPLNDAKIAENTTNKNNQLKGLYNWLYKGSMRP